MQFGIENLIMLALFVEGSIQGLKPIWNAEAKKLSLTEVISTLLGIAIAVLAKINMLDGMLPITNPVLLYMLYVLTGVGLGRGPSFLHDLWAKIKSGIAAK